MKAPKINLAIKSFSLFSPTAGQNGRIKDALAVVFGFEESV